MARIQGHTASGYEEVRQVFEDNFRIRKELGAAVAVVVQNQLVVDLWGGIADAKAKRPWAEDTMVNMFSVTKGMAGLAIAHAHSRGLFDYDEKVAVYWPEFLVNGKGDATVRTLLSHQAGIPGSMYRLTSTPSLIPTRWPPLSPFRHRNGNQARSTATTLSHWVSTNPS